jgi:N-acetylglucosamine-6-phosphate deacetylase
MTVRVLTNARLVLPDRVVDNGWLAVRAGRIAALGSGEPPATAAMAGAGTDNAAGAGDVERQWVLPGYIDVHCHGGGGSALYTGDVDDVRRAAAAHLRRGTTSMLASVGTTQPETMLAAARAIARAIDDGTAPNLRGIHFEGPFLSAQRRGAQTASALRLPDEAFYAELIEAAGGHARAMTIAPELDGALELIRRHADELVFCIGHTDADAGVFAAAVDAGARHVTHLFNAMPALGHRAPGPVGRALLDPRVTVELIADGHHLAADTVRLALETAGTERIVLVTDAMAAAGLGDGRYSFVDRTVDVRDGAAFLRDTDTLAGSTAFIADAASRAESWGALSPAETARISAANAARLLGWSDRGLLQAGAVADLVVSPDGSHPSAIALAGQWRPAESARHHELAVA